MSKRDLLLLGLIVLLLQGPFLNKPYHIDDTFVLYIAHNIIDDPLDPFAGTFDWFGYNRPIFESTTNPPLVSYYLAPFSALSNDSEIVLHSAMLLFYMLLAVGVFLLAKRFCQMPWMATLFVMAGPAVMVSGNVMRDIPAAALAVFGIALFILGSDRNRNIDLALGSVFAGLSIVAKYSAVIAVPLLILYPLLKRRYRHIVWVWPALLVFAVWCFHNWVVYDAIHIVYLTLKRRSEAGITWHDKLCGAIVILGSVCYLFPAVLWNSIRKRMILSWISFAILLPLAWWFVQTHFHGKADVEYLFWCMGGTILLVYCLLLGGVRLDGLWCYDEEKTDTLFLCAWLCAPVLFSIFLVPFQAVRHLILALPPIVFLILHSVEDKQNQTTWFNALIGLLLLLQTAIGYGVHAADCEYANGYRQFTEQHKNTWGSNGETVWFLGHWGWQFYAERAGFRQIHRGEDMPQTGDIVLRPTYAPVDLRTVFDGNEDVEERMELVDEIRFEKHIPIHVINWGGASFYAVIGAWGTPNMPYRIWLTKPHETITVYRMEKERT